ncbi:MAG: hypothetical protein ACE5QV_01880 [Fidelibacterota bacterium]
MKRFNFFFGGIISSSIITAAGLIGFFLLDVNKYYPFLLGVGVAFLCMSASYLIHKWGYLGDFKRIMSTFGISIAVKLGIIFASYFGVKAFTTLDSKFFLVSAIFIYLLLYVYEVVYFNLFFRWNPDVRRDATST